MSYIPNCRPKMAKEAGSAYRKTSEIPEDEINAYYYGLLESPDKDFVCGYDWNTERVINNLFDNLDIYANKFEEIGINIDDVDTDIVNGAYDEANINFNNEFADKRPVKWYCQYDIEEIEAMNTPTKLMLLMKYIINDYIEMQRDELVTSMIEDMDDKDHERRMKEVADVKN